MNHRKPIVRMFEILPGLAAWASFIAPVVLSFWWPVVVAEFIIAYDCFFLWRSIRLTFNIVRAYYTIQTWLKQNWDQKIKAGDVPKLTPTGRPTVITKIDPDSLVHVVMLIFYKESYELLDLSLKSYADSNIPKDKLWILLASEERAGEYGHTVYNQVKAHYGDRFGKIILSTHPANIPGEIKCKSSNATFAGKVLKETLDKLHKPYDEVLIHNFDADTRVYPNYFSAVAYTYLKSEYGMPTSFQPIHIYSNNIWDTPALMRLVAQSASAVWMNNAFRPHRFKHFSSRSDVFSTIVSINYWTVDSIPEDSRQYFDSYFIFHGRLKIEPIYVPLRMDAVLSDTYGKTILNQYRQLRRWAWGIVDLGYVVDKAVDDKAIPWSQKLEEILKLFESHYSWATSAVFITIFAWLPIVLNPAFTHTVLGTNLLAVTQFLLGLALVGMFATVVVSFLMLPPRPKDRHPLSYVSFLLQWVLSPIASIFLSTLAAIDAQTRLMFGRYMEYQITDKTVGKSGGQVAQAAQSKNS